MGGGEMPKIPDWKIYTIGEHVPELQHTQRMLKSVGLKVIIFCNKICHLIICFMFSTRDIAIRLKSTSRFGHAEAAYYLCSLFFQLGEIKFADSRFGLRVIPDILIQTFLPSSIYLKDG